MSTLLSKVAATAAKDRVKRNTVVQVKSIDVSDPDPKKHFVHGVDILTRKEMRIFMGKAPNPDAENQRITISDLHSNQTRKVETDGFISVDRLASRNGSDYECMFLRTIKSSPQDNDRHFMVGLVRPFPVQNKDVPGSNPFAVVDYVIPDKTTRVSNGGVLVNTIANHLMNQDYGALGAPMALLRDGPNTQPMRVVAKMINEDGVYRLPNDEEVMDQLSKDSLVTGLKAGLDAAGGSASVEILAGNRFIMSGNSAVGSAYKVQSEKLFRGTFKMFNPEDDGRTMINKVSNGFRTGILQFNKSDDRFFLNGVTATLSDSLTLTGSADSKAIFIQKQSNVAIPSNHSQTSESEQSNTQSPSNIDDAINDVFAGGGDDDIDSLIDGALSSSEIDEMETSITQAAEEYASLEESPGMSN